ncbi:MAG TPA: hypothetical protein VGI70_03960, partial [Polyangiales bacterium]
MLLLPSIVRGKVSSLVEQRFGLHATVDGVSPGLSGLTLSGLHLASEEGEGVELSAQRVDVEFGWASALVNGSSAVTGVHVNGVDAELDLASAAYQRVRSKLRSGDSEGSGSHHARTLSATHYSLTVRDGKDELLTVDGSDAELAPTQITASLARMHASRPGLASAAMSGIELRANRGDGVQLQELHV